MVSIEDVYRHFLTVTHDPVAASILCVASELHGIGNGENLGHEMALALKNVLQESTVNISGGVIVDINE